MHETITKESSSRTKYLDRPKPGIIYFRAGKTRVRLPDDEASPEFAAAYDAQFAALKASKPRVVGRPRHMIKPVSTNKKLVTTVNGIKRYSAPLIGWFVEQYLASDFFAQANKPNLKERPLRPGTQSNYRIGLNLMRDMGMTDTNLHDLNPRNANLYIQKVKRERGGSAALVQKYLLSNLWTFAKRFPEFESGDRPNPLLGGEIETPYRVRQEHKPWPEEVQDRFVETCNDDLRLAFYLLLCTGQRVGDVIRMKWADFDGTHITLVQQKDREGRPIIIRAPELLVSLLAGRRRSHENILTHAWGRPWASGASLYHRIKKVLRAVGADGLTVHGLRKNAGIMLAMNGASVPVIMACLGHKTEKMALYYVRLAQQGELAEQGAAIMDAAFAKRAAAKVAAKRAAIRRVT